MKMNPLGFLMTLGLLFVSLNLEAQSDQDRKDTLKYGLEGDIKSLLSQLVREKNPAFNQEIQELYARSTNTNILQAVVQYALETRWEGFRTLVLDAGEKLDKMPLGAKLSVISLMAELQWNDAEPILMRWSRGEDKPLALAALRTLGKLGTPEAGPLLMEKLKDPETDRNFLSDIYWALGEMKYQQAMEPMKLALEDSSTPALQKKVIIEAVGKMGFPEGLPLVETFLNDTNVLLRAEAIKALSGYPSRPGVGDLYIEGLRDSEGAVRLAAAEGAGKLKADNTVDIIKYRITRDPDSKVRAAAMKALVEIQGGAGKSFITDLIKEGKTDLITWKTALTQGLDWPETVTAVEALLERTSRDRTSPHVLELANIYANRKQAGLEKIYSLLLESPVPGVKAVVLRGILLNRTTSLGDKVKALESDQSIGPQAKRTLEDLNKTPAATTP